MTTAQRPNIINPMQFPAREAVAFDPRAFEEAILAHGLALEHHRAMRCPVGMTSRGDNVRVHEDHSGCSHGYLYTRAGITWALMTSMSGSNAQKEFGSMSEGRAQATFTSAYADTQAPVYVQVYDRFYTCDPSVLVTTWELAALPPGRSRIRCRYPVEQVVDLVSSRGERFENPQIVDGEIVAPDRSILPGAVEEVWGVRYLYRPYWILESLGHETRMIQVPDVAVGAKGSTVKAPQSASLVREYLFRDQEQDGVISGDSRRIASPAPDPRGYEP